MSPSRFRRKPAKLGVPDDVYDHIEMCEKQLDRYVEHRISSGSDKDVEDLWTATSRRFERNRPVQRLYDWRDKLAIIGVSAKQIFQDARDAGISEPTLRIAKTQLGVKSEKAGTEGWQWVLPAALSPLAPLSPSKTASPDSAYYLWEDDKDDKGDKPRAEGYNLPSPAADDVWEEI
jgi:hypothetical protein